MKENPVKALSRQSKPIVNGWLSIPDGFAAEVMARAGWDSVTVDMQHGLSHYESAIQCIRAINTTGTLPMVRVPWNEPGIIMKMLDGGAMGVICPMVSNRAEAEAFVGACRYPPLGYRSFGPIRSLMTAGPKYVADSGELVLTLAMIETRESLDNLDAIMSTPGLDGIYIGPSDLSLALDRPPDQDSTEPLVVETIDRILATAKKHGLIAGLHNATAAYARKMLDKGFDLVTIGSDSRLLTAAAKVAIAEARGETVAQGGGGWY